MTATLDRPAPGPAAPVATACRPRDSHLKVTWFRIVHSEWIKFRSLRSTWFGLAATVVVIIGLTALTAGVLSGNVQPDVPSGTGNTAATNPATSSGPVVQSLHGAGITDAGIQLAQLVVIVLGVLMVTSEYSSGVIRPTFAAVRSRWSVLSAKAVVIAVSVFVVVAPSTLVAFLWGQVIMGDDGVSLTAKGVIGALTGQVMYLTGAALLGVAIGAIIRGTAGSISTLFGLILVVPGVLQLILPNDWVNNVVPYLPSEAGTSMASTTPQDGMLSCAAGAWVFAAWVVGLIVVAAISLRRRDS